MSTATVTPDAGAAVSTPATSTPAAPASQPAAQPGTPAQQPQQDSGNIAQLRTAYDGLKSKHEAWEKLGFTPEQATQHSGVYQKVWSEAGALGRELGYPDDEIAEALVEDPLKTIQFLQNEAAQRSQGGDPNQGADLRDQIADYANQVLGPIQQRENVRMTNEANSLFERTVHQMATDLFKKEGIDYASLSEDEKFFISSGVSEVLKYDQQGLQALKFEGKTASVQKAFQEFINLWDKAYLARASRERSRVAPPNRGGNPAPNQQTGKKPTLDEMIENPSVIDEAAGRDPRTGRYR